jgi:hypothetical protein
MELVDSMFIVRGQFIGYISIILFDVNNKLLHFSYGNWR